MYKRSPSLAQNPLLIFNALTKSYTFIGVYQRVVIDPLIHLDVWNFSTNPISCVFFINFKCDLHVNAERRIACATICIIGGGNSRKLPVSVKGVNSFTYPIINIETIGEKSKNSI